MISNNEEFSLKTVDIRNLNLDTIFLHYTAKKNLSTIFERGLEPRIGRNSKVIEKSKKVFFSVGDQGALMIMDVWLRWLVMKPKSNFIYWIGAYLLNVKFFPKFIHDIIIYFNKKSKNKHEWAFKKLQNILDNSVYLVLNLEENIDFSFSDNDEVKTRNYPEKYYNTIYIQSVEQCNYSMEYWNMHTYSNKTIDSKKIELLQIGDSSSANDLLIYMAHKNKEYVKNNCKLLEEYLKKVDANWEK